MFVSEEYVHLRQYESHDLIDTDRANPFNFNIAHLNRARANAFSSDMVQDAVQ